eukprot:COSAG02_NODE_36415_length_454_cov_15.923944_1_plen_89_part_10
MRTVLYMYFARTDHACPRIPVLLVAVAHRTRAYIDRATYSGSSMAVTCACVLLVLASVGAALPVDSRYELDEMGEPEWNFPADWDGSAQ